jgi:hypothetical protein
MLMIRSNGNPLIRSSPKTVPSSASNIPKVRNTGPCPCPCQAPPLSAYVLLHLQLQFELVLVELKFREKWKESEEKEEGMKEVRKIVKDCERLWKMDGMDGMTS